MPEGVAANHVEQGDAASQSMKTCPYCLDTFPMSLQNEHVDSTRHLLNYLLHSYSTHRREYSQNRHGVIVSVTSAEELKRRNKKSTYCCVIPADKERNATFGLMISNNTTDEMFLTEVCRLYSNPCYSLSDEAGFADVDEGKSIKITPGANYNFKLNFTNEGVGSYRIPIHFRITLLKGSKKQKDFSIIREIRVDSQGDVKLPYEDEKIKSPYSGDSWSKIGTIMPGSTDKGKPILRLTGFKIPADLKLLLKRNLLPFNGMTQEQRRKLDLFHAQFAKTSPDQLTAVTKSNYTEFFHDLLYVEEKENKDQMAKYNMSDVVMRLHNFAEVELDVPGLAEKRPSILKRDIVFARVHGDVSYQYEGQVKSVGATAITISGFHPLFLNILRTGEMRKNPVRLDVRFEFGRYPIYIQHHALSKLSPEILSMLFPESGKCGKWAPLVVEKRIEQVKFINPEVDTNEEQKKAILNILRGSSLPAPYIVFGPPGTGKTVTLVEAILQVKNELPYSHILVSAQCNSACDYIASKLYASGSCKKSEILRFNSATRDPNIPEDILPICTDHLPSLKDLKNYRIIVCTLCSAGRFSTKHKFTHVFIDEVGQAAEPEAIVAISGILETPAPGKAAGVLVLAGDPMQLGPVCSGNKAKAFGLAVSLLDRLMGCVEIYQDRGAKGYDGRFISKLVKNFRSHAEILTISNELFYKKELVAMTVTDPLCDYSLNNPGEKGHPTLFHGVIGIEEREGKSPSIFNLMEASVVVDYVKKLLKCKVSEPVQLEDIGVITPYTRQVHKLKQKFSELGWDKVEVGTVEIFQGREKRVIVVSTVRSQTKMLEEDKKFRLGFLREPKRFNVIMTRAQSKLIVIGNPSLLGLDPVWKTFIDKTVASRSYYGCRLVYRDERFVEEVYSKMGRVHSERPPGQRSDA